MKNDAVDTLSPSVDEIGRRNRDEIPALLCVLPVVVLVCGVLAASAQAQFTQQGP
jgi:hypothetical protein